METDIGQTPAPSISDTPLGPKIPTAGFAILIDDEGSVYIERSPKVLSIPVEREATLIEIRRYLSEILMDLQAQAAAEYTVLRLSPPNPDTK